ncbi:hypothetical protein ABZX69_13495 [Streptomyces sp. NPDC004074]|uniref:hypothetical protein n=1 Tax=Streptomyces sp. NPDC004074 TaxID=3154277 RepID=UPI0033B23009
MGAADLDYRARTLTGCIHPRVVARLLELGYEREVEFQASHGEWFCALEWARLLRDRRQREPALDVLAPYIATGWWPAAQAQAQARCWRATVGWRRRSLCLRGEVRQEVWLVASVFAELTDSGISSQEPPLRYEVLPSFTAQSESHLRSAQLSGEVLHSESFS